MRDSYAEFTRRGVEILAVGPDTLKSFQKYWENERIPFIGIPDPTHRVARLYRQQVLIFKLGRMPLNAVIDARGYIRYAHYAANMADIPDNEIFLNVIDKLNASSE